MARGDEFAVALFYRSYFDVLYRMACHAGARDESMCLDVVQDAVLRIVRCVRPVREEPQFRAWLRLVVQSHVLDHLRAERRRLRRESAYANSRSLHREASAESEQVEQLVWLRDQIGQLEPQLCDLIDLRFEQGWTLRRIAAWRGGTAGQIDGLLRRALAKLQRTAQEKWK